MKPEILERQIAHAGYITVEQLRMRLSDGAEVSREVERHGDAVAVLPYDVERRSDWLCAFSCACSCGIRGRDVGGSLRRDDRERGCRYDCAP